MCPSLTAWENRKNMDSGIWQTWFKSLPRHLEAMSTFYAWLHMLAHQLRAGVKWWQLALSALIISLGLAQGFSKAEDAWDNCGSLSVFTQRRHPCNNLNQCDPEPMTKSSLFLLMQTILSTFYPASQKIPWESNRDPPWPRVMTQSRPSTLVLVSPPCIHIPWDHLPK